MIKIINKILKKSSIITIHAPLTGKLINLEKVNDHVFSSKMLGEGFAIIPTEKIITLLAPMSGNLTTVMESGHAYGITELKTGLECLIHIGLDTIELEGKGFNKKVSAGENIKVLDQLAIVDLQVIKDNKKDPVTPIVFTNYPLENKYKLIIKENLVDKIVNKGTIVAEIIKNKN